MSFRAAGLFLSILLIGAQSIADSPLSEKGRATSWPVCKTSGGSPLTTMFTAERSVSFRERNSSRSHFETADTVLRGDRIDHCGFSNNSFRSQDQAQTMVAADLLSRSREISIAAQERAVRDIGALKACVSSPSAPQCGPYREKILPDLESEFELMRVLRAIAQASPGRACANEAAKLADASTRVAAASAMFGGGSSTCFASNEISHDAPFLSSLFGGDSTPRPLAALSSKEQALIQKIFMERGNEIFSGAQGRSGLFSSGSTGKWEDFQKGAQADYERLLLKYPIFNYLEGETLGSSDLRGAFDQVEKNAKEQLDRLKNSKLTDVGTLDGALAQAISELPEDMRGDYCHVANQMDDDLWARKAGRTMLLVGAGLATMGMGLLPATAVGATAEGAMAYHSLSEYSYQSLRCQSGADGSPNCSADRLKEARDSLYSPTDGALFLAGGAIDAAGAVRHLMRGASAAAEAVPTTGLTGSIATPAGAEPSLSAFSPISQPTSVKTSALEASDRATADSLKRMGVQTTALDDPARRTYLQNIETYGWHDTKILPGADGRKSYGTMYRVDSLPPTSKIASVYGNALKHPEMPEYLRKMRALGYDLVIDSSIKHSGAAAYFSEHGKLIALKPNTTWQTFLHEYQHLEFSTSILKYNFMDPMVQMRLAGKDLRTDLHPAVIAEIGADKVAKIQRLIDRGITPSNAIDESLSVGRELEALGWRKFIPGVGGGGPYRYALTHQITDLEALGSKMTPQQRRLVTQLKLQHLATYGVELGAAGAAGLGLAAAGSYAFQSQQYSEIYYDDKGNMIGVKPDGSRYYIKLKSN